MTKAALRALLVLALGIGLAGCVSTDVTSVSNPALVKDRTFTRVLVATEKMPLDEALAIETETIRLLETGGLYAIGRSTVLPLTQRHSATEVDAVLDSHRFDGVLIISLTDKSVKQDYIPPSYTPGKTTSSVSMIGNTPYVTTHTTPGYVTGGYSITKPQALYEASFYDAVSGDRLWLATAKSRGGGTMEYVDLAKSMAAETVAKLKSDGLLQLVKQ